MKEEIINLYKNNTEAIPTNRGFYYQNLKILQTWVTNFLEDKNSLIYVEANEDIKEVGNEIIFTQVKCYASDFNLNSEEIKKAIFNFFIIYLEHSQGLKELKFHFFTNTSIKKREKLLQRWVADPNLTDNELRNICANKIKLILENEFKRKRDLKLSDIDIQEKKREGIKSLHEEIKKLLGTNLLTGFVECIFWEFGDDSPELAIKNLENEIINSLKNLKFKNKSPYLLISILLSIIYKKSTLKNEEQRKLNNSILIEILEQTEADIIKETDRRIISLIGVNYFELNYEIEKVKKEIQNNTNDIKKLKSNSFFTFQKNLSFIPKITSSNYINRADSEKELSELINSEKIILLNAMGGLGKTTFLKAYVSNQKDNYDHIIWISCISNWKQEIALNDVLIKNLNLEFDTYDSIDSRFDIIINQINIIGNRNLLIIDSINNEEGISINAELNKINNDKWSIILASRSKISNIKSYNLNSLNFDEAKKLVTIHYKKKQVDDYTLKLFFEFVGYNTLMIELCSKTINNSLDLDFVKFLQYLNEQELNKNELAINIDDEYNTNGIQLLPTLLNTFSISNLEKLERHILELLAIMPSDETYISEFIEIYGPSHYDKNKVDILNCINSLDKKGWVTKDENRVIIHKLIQETIKYKVENYIGHVFFIIFLSGRIEEMNQISSSDGFKYIKYSESILKAIKQKNRESIEQPLIVLENNLIQTYRILGVNVYDRQLLLLTNAENFLSANDPVLGVTYNNVAIEYMNKDEYDLAIKYLTKAISIFVQNEEKYHLYLINSLDNLASIYIFNNHPDLRDDAIDKSKKIREKYLKPNDPSFSTMFHLLAVSHQRSGNYEESIKLSKTAIDMHKSEDMKSRNDYKLAHYYSTLSTNYFIKSNIDDALNYQLKSVSILEKLGLKNNPSLLKFYGLTALIYLKLNDMENYNYYTEKTRT